MPKREVPKLKKDNFVAWKSLMKLHLGSIGDHAQSSIVTEHIDPTGTITVEDLKNKQEHNQTMLEIASALNYAEFDDIKGCNTAFKMWKALSDIYGGDLNVQREKRESLKGKFDDMKMEEGENVAPYGSRIKEVAKLSLKDTEQVKSKMGRKMKYVSSDSSTDEEDVEQLEALLARRFHKGKGKFKGNFPIICFNCNEVGHIAARCTQKKDYKEGIKCKNRREDDKRDYKDKGKKCYITEEDSNDNDDEVVYVAMKD